MSALRSKQAACPTRPSPACQCGACRSCALRAAWADGKYAGRREALSWRTWTEEQDAALARMAGTMDLADIARVLSERFGIARTVTAVQVRSVRLGISVWRQGYSMYDLVDLFGISGRTIIRGWVTPGLLRGKRWQGRGSSANWLFAEAEIERFIRESPWAYDWRKMRPHRRLSRLAEVVAKLDPWLSYHELVRYVGMTRKALDKWRHRGLVPCRRRPGADGIGEVVVRGREFRAIREAIRAAQQRERQMAMSKLGEAVKALRALLRRSQRQAAVRGGCSVHLIALLETGRRRYVTRRDVDNLARGLDVPPEQLWACIPEPEQGRQFIPLW